MIKTTPIYISSRGGSIVCFQKANNRIFQSCSSAVCKYSGDLHSAKKNLNAIESTLLLSPNEEMMIPRQRKTTLKWNNDGELSEIDKARILGLLSEKELIECKLSCVVD